MVHEGQQVKAGDVIGTVGNTGNAQYTPAHLHFGIYTFGGAIDPLPFVKREQPTPKKPADRELDRMLQVVKPMKSMDSIVLPAATELVPLAVTSKGYLAEQPDGQWVEVDFKSVKAIKPNATAVTQPAVVGKRS